MKELPVSIRQRSLRQILRDPLGGARLRRPADGMYKDLAAGDRLWLREAFHLEKHYDFTSPSVARARGAQPVFAANLHTSPAADSVLGNSRPAYTLLRDWHRYHFTVLAVEHQRLHDITLAEVQAEGFETREAWFEEWDDLISSVNGTVRDRRAAANPEVLAIDIELRREPLQNQRKEAA